MLLVPSAMSAGSRDNSNYHRTTTERGNSNSRPGGSHGNSNHPGGSSNHRPGSHKPDNKPNHKPDYKPNHKPGHNNYYKPGHNNHYKPGHNHGWGGSSVNAPGYGSRHHHNPYLGNMVNYAIRGGRYDNVWMVAPGQYAVRFYRNGYYYIQYLWPEIGRYGTPFRVVLSSPGQWYAYDNCNQWFYDDGNSLRISLNGTPMNPWTAVPSVELNINF